MSKFEPHDYFMFNPVDHNSREIFKEHVRKTYDQIRELADFIEQYEGTIDTEFKKIVTHVNEQVKQMTDLYDELKISETIRVANEEERISNDIERDSKIENIQSEVISARGGEAVLGDRLDRIESAAGEGSTEITIEDFIDFQDVIGGRNLLVERTKNPTHSGIRWETDYIEVESNGVYSFSFSGSRQWDQIFEYNADKEEVTSSQKTASHGDFVHVISDDTRFIRYTSGVNNAHSNTKIESGEKTTPYTLAPEDYEEVTLTDLANHAKIIFGGEFTKLRNAITSLGGNV